MKIGRPAYSAALTVPCLLALTASPAFAGANSEYEEIPGLSTEVAIVHESDVLGTGARKQGAPQGEQLAQTGTSDLMPAAIAGAGGLALAVAAALKTRKEADNG